MQSLFTWLLSRFRARPGSVPQEQPWQREVFPRVYGTLLEDRRVLSADPVSAAADWSMVTLSAGEGANDGRQDRFELSQTVNQQGEKNLTLRVNSVEVLQIAPEAFGTIRLQGSSDQDLFVIDVGMELPPNVVIDGGSLSATDQVIFVSSATDPMQSIDYRLEENRFILQFDRSDSSQSSSITVSGIHSIVDEVQTNERVFGLDTDAASWVLHQEVLELGDSQSLATFTLQSTDYSVQFHEPGQTLLLDSRSEGSDTIRFEGDWHRPLHRIEVIGDQHDSFELVGRLEFGSSFDVHTGAVRWSGEAQSIQGRIDMRADSIQILGTMDVGSGWIRLDAGPEGTLFVGGRILATGSVHGQGGEVILLGQEIDLSSQAWVDVSGMHGGGRIFIGGGIQGADPRFLNAWTTTIDAGARIQADAHFRGAGGTIVVWSDSLTTIANAGGISARGGLHGGNGGWIETSGKKILRIEGAVDSSSPQGLGGTWVIDPENIEVVAAVPLIPAPNTSYVTIASINIALSSGLDVTLQTSANASVGGDIIFNEAVIAYQLLAPN